MAITSAEKWVSSSVKHFFRVFFTFPHISLPAVRVCIFLYLNRHDFSLSITLSPRLFWFLFRSITILYCFCLKNSKNLLDGIFECYIAYSKKKSPSLKMFFGKSWLISETEGNSLNPLSWTELFKCEYSQKRPNQMKLKRKKKKPVPKIIQFEGQQY